MLKRAWRCLFLHHALYNRGPQRAASNRLHKQHKQLVIVFEGLICVSFDFAQDHELVEWQRFEAAYRLVFVWA
jgi:hypothetical protein